MAEQFFGRNRFVDLHESATVAAHQAQWIDRLMLSGHFRCEEAVGQRRTAQVQDQFQVRTITHAATGEGHGCLNSVEPKVVFRSAKERSFAERKTTLAPGQSTIQLTAVRRGRRGRAKYRLYHSIVSISASSNEKRGDQPRTVRALSEQRY